MIKGVTEKEFEIIKNILDEYDNYSFYFYGSRVKGNFQRTSDLDILIKGKNQMPFEKLEILKEKFDESNLPYVVNFSDYNLMNLNFYKMIEKDLVNYKI